MEGKRCGRCRCYGGSQIIGEYGGEDSEKYSSLGYILKVEPIEPY